MAAAFSCPGVALVGTGAIAQLAPGAYVLSYSLLGTQVDPTSPNFQWPVDPGLTATFVDAAGRTQKLSLTTAQYTKAFTTGPANPPGSTFAVTLTSPNAGNILEVTIDYATLSGNAPVVSHT